MPRDRLQRARGVRRERVARVGPTHVGCNGAAQTARVLLGITEVVRGVSLLWCGVGPRHSGGEGIAVRPAADHLGGEPLRRLRAGDSPHRRGALLDEAPEAGEVLRELAEDQIGAIRSEESAPVALLQRPPAIVLGRHAGRQGVGAIFVDLTEDELARADGGLRRRVLLGPSLERRLRDPVAATPANRRSPISTSLSESRW